MRTLLQIILLVVLSLNCRAQIAPILRNVFTTNTFDTDIVGGAIPYFDFPSGKFVATGISYTNGIYYDPIVGILSIVHTNSTGDALLVLGEGGPAGASIQGYADKFVGANTNLTLDAVGPFSVRLRVNGSNQVEAVSGGISLSATTNILGDDGAFLTYNGVELVPATNLWASSGSVLSPSPAVNIVNASNFSSGHFPIGIQQFLGGPVNNAFAYITNVYSKNLPTGDNSILTVPSGYRFLLIRNIVVPTNTAIASSWISVLTNGVTTRLRQASAIPTNGSALFAGQGNNFVFEQNETFVIHSATNLQRTAVLGLVFTNSIPLKSHRNLALSGGDNTLYTVPANTFAVAYVPDGNTIANTVEYFNGTAGSVTNAFYLIPSGEVKDINSKFSTSVVGTLSQSALSIQPMFFPGDSILIECSSSASGQVAWITVWEQQMGAYPDNAELK